MSDKTFKWVVEFEVTENWVEDGFSIDDERAESMLAEALPYAYGSELSARVISTPPNEEVLKTFGISQSQLDFAEASMAAYEACTPNEIFDWIMKHKKAIAKAKGENHARS